MERIAILSPEVREHPALSPFFSIPEKANKRVKRVNSQALGHAKTPLRLHLIWCIIWEVRTLAIRVLKMRDEPLLVYISHIKIREKWYVNSEPKDPAAG